MSAWTSERDAQLRALWGEGLSCTEIGRRMRITKNAVIGRAHRLLLAKRENPTQPGTFRTWTTAEDDQARALRAAGHDLQEIAQQLGRTRAAVKQRMAAIGVVAPPRPRNDGVRTLVARGAAVVQRAKQNSIGAAAAPTPPALPVLPPNPLVAVNGGCRFPMWGDHERPTHLFCGEAQAMRADGVRLPYCPGHAARCFTREHARELNHQVTRRTFAWGGVAA